MPTDTFSSVRGLCPRGAFDVSINWARGKLASAEIKSKTGGPCTIRYQDRILTIKTEAGKSYRYNGKLVERKRVNSRLADNYHFYG